MQNLGTQDDPFKFRVAVKALRGEKAISEIATHSEVRLNQMIKREKELLKKAGSVFSKK